ncbi:glycine--tRNA ligase subunit beta [Bacillus timonensis]|nr:glycine--tRNA ligase subunit beta [Bacillus timonensis]
MSKRDLLIEIGLEEMPARFVVDSMNQLADKMTSWLLEKNIRFDQVRSFSTPRRLAVLITDLAEKQEDQEIEAKGPAKKIALDNDNNWTKAAIGFTKGQNASVDDIYFKEINGVEYAHITKNIKGQETINELPEIEKLIKNMSFPKNMKWGTEELKFVRPIKWVLALYGNEVFPLTISNVTSSNTTRGHRFLGTEIEIPSPREYEQKLLSQYVIADSLERKEAIVQQIKTIEQENNWVIPIDQSLLDEVNNLVEYPTALYGNFEEDFLQLPEEVLITSMKEHQRYFPVKNKEGKLLPSFVTIRNGDHKHIGNVAKGNEKVLRARLSDANFFYQEDLKLKIDDLVKKLDSIVYHEEIGSLGNKVSRIKNISKDIAHLLKVDEKNLPHIERAAEICKFDLVTHMVYEFPELQGLMGEKYATLSGEHELVAKAINEHYKPRFAEDTAPSSDIGAIISIADKIDTIVSCFAIGIIPTGSQDPYALRRQAAGIVQILHTNRYNLCLESLLDHVLSIIGEAGILKKEKQEVLDQLIQFFKMRVKNVLSDRGVRYDIIDAVLGSNIEKIDMVIQKAEVLEQQKSSESFKEVIESLSRVLNISKKGEIGEINQDLFASDEEKNLYEKYVLVQTEVKGSMESNDAHKAFTSLASLQHEIDSYFENTMVMSEDENVRKNRLTQMALIAEVIYLFADMNALIVK